MSADPRFGPDARPLTVVRSPTARGLRLSVDPRNGLVRLSLPKHAVLRSAFAWAESKRIWIERQLAALPEPQPFEPGGQLIIDDQHHRIAWRADWPRKVMPHPGELRVGGPIDLLPARLTRWLKGEALRVLEQETRNLAARVDRKVSRVSVNDPRSRWGSCAHDSSIRYSWRLILAPRFVREATVAHEVAHLVHMNHGPAFHALVRQLLGADPAPARAWLRANGAQLYWVGRS